MKLVRFRWAQLPILWRLTLWSSLLLCCLFIAYTVVQYIVINQWMMSQEEKAIRKNMDEIIGYFQEKNAAGTEQIQAGSSFLRKIIQTNQLIRVLDGDGTIVVSLSNKLPEDWVVPFPVKQPQLTSIWHVENHLLIMRQPLSTQGFSGSVEIANNLEHFDMLNNMILLVMVAGGFGAVLLSGIGGMLIARQLLKPVQSVTETMRRIKQKGIHERVASPNNHDEISMLAKLFNDMMDQVETSFQKQKQFVEDASHELRTPIAIIEGHLSLLDRWGKNDPALVDESLTASLQELQRLKGIVRELLELTRADSQHQAGQTEQVKLAKKVLHTVKNVSVLHPQFTFHSDLHALSGAVIRIAPQHLEQILLILLDNAVKYSRDRREIRITGALRDRMVCLDIADYGIGIPEADLPYVFDRFYRVDKARSRERGGTGLGLAICKKLVERYGGEIGLTSKENAGTRVTLRFPAEPSP
ncbi:HAMP domain-containing histidine kinase [Paenibacillus doosanensis]|nr:HAMP domain-containing histidine kinase [Paenibacillus konkukensis]MCS7459035.1 HAMP domain-containing histidine kinase [Paenibacillus doosanensis]